MMLVTDDRSLLMLSQAAADNARLHALQLDEAANRYRRPLLPMRLTLVVNVCRRVARLLEHEEKTEEHDQ